MVIPPSYAVITVCRNSGKTLARTMRSVLTQAHPPAEYLIGDGNSSDETREVFAESVAQYAGARTRVEWIDQGHPLGIANAWNVGVRCATAELLFILNSDDWYEQGCAAAVCEHFGADHSLDLLCGAVSLVTPDAPFRRRLLLPRTRALSRVMPTIPHPAVFARRDVYERAGNFDPRYAIAADCDFLYRCMIRGCRFRFDSSIVVNQQAGGLASQSRAIARREVLDIGVRNSGSRALPYLAYGVRRLMGR